MLLSQVDGVQICIQVQHRWSWCTNLINQENSANGDVCLVTDSRPNIATDNDDQYGTRIASVCTMAYFYSFADQLSLCLLFVGMCTACCCSSQLSNRNRHCLKKSKQKEEETLLQEGRQCFDNTSNNACNVTWAPVNSESVKGCKADNGLRW